MLLFLSSVPAEQQMQVTPEEMQKAMQPWFDWFAKVGDAVVDKGMPLGNGMNVSTAGASDRKTQVAGYEIIQAADTETAKKLVTGHPHLMRPGASIEVLEYMPMPGM